MKLSVATVKQRYSINSPLKLSDGGGLFLLIQPNNAKYWRLAYRFAGKQKTLALGVYPEVSLADAREHREKARKLLATGVDPSENRKAIRISKVRENANSFEVIAREWCANRSATWAPSHAQKVIRRLERDVFPWIGSRALPLKNYWLLPTE